MNLAGYNIKLGRIKIVSYCSVAEREVKKRAEDNLNKLTRFEAPKLVAKLEEKLRRKVGEELVVKLASF